MQRTTEQKKNENIANVKHVTNFKEKYKKSSVFSDTFAKLELNFLWLVIFIHNILKTSYGNLIISM